MENFIPKSLEPSTVDLLIGFDYFWTIVGRQNDFTFGIVFGFIKNQLHSYCSYLDPTSKQQNSQQLITSCSVMT